MEKEHPYDRFYQTLLPMIQDKKEELIICGIMEVKNKELWALLKANKWKKPKEDIHLYELAQDILSLSVTQYVTYLQIEAYKVPPSLGKLSKDDLDAIINN